MHEGRTRNEAREQRWRAWMIATQSGDAAAYEKLLHELLPYVRRFVQRRLGDSSVWEDVVQNVFVSVHRARHTYRPERPFGPWLHAVARNAVIDQARVRSRRSQRETSLEAEGVPEPVAAPSSDAHAPLSKEMVRALDGLPASQREAVELIHVEGLSVAEAAAWVGITRSALKVRAHRGYRALRLLLGGEPT
jgi:RNA polymerase sigma-70 factor (ECF subfamily)